MAAEVHEKLNGAGVPTALLTGQEILNPIGARHVAATVEMATLDTTFDCAVIDECQLIGDPSRGWAFTRAFLGLQAMEIHVCGAPALLDICQRLAERCGDTVERRSYERLSPLTVGKKNLGGWAGLQKGDCVVAFWVIFPKTVPNRFEIGIGVKLPSRESARNFSSGVPFCTGNSPPP